MFNNIHEVEGLIIPNNLFSFINSRVEQLLNEVITFKLFTGEALIYALIEYSSFNRNMTEDERYIYLYEKAYLYENGKDCKSPNGVIEGNIYIDVPEVLPF